MHNLFDGVTLGISAASVITSVVAALYAKSSLGVAKQMADRAHLEWKQRQWVELYREADHAYDMLDELQTHYKDQSHENPEYESAYNAVMIQFRRAHSLAAVFPVSPPIDALFKASAAFANAAEARSAQRLEQISFAVEGIREQALIDSSILD